MTICQSSHFIEQETEAERWHEMFEENTPLVVKLKSEPGNSCSTVSCLFFKLKPRSPSSLLQTQRAGVVSFSVTDGGQTQGF